jgi:GAF domain-containing protein
MPDAADLERQIADRDREIAALRERLQAEVDTLKYLIEVATRLNSTLNLSELLQMLMNATRELLHAEDSSLLLVDEETQELTFEVATGDTAEEVVKHRVPPGQGIAGWVVQHAQPLRSDAPALDPRFYGGIDQSLGFQTRSILAVPLVVRDRVIGVVEAINKRDAPGFSDQDLELALAFASQAAVAIDNAQLYARLAEAVVTSRLSYRL